MTAGDFLTSAITGQEHVHLSKTDKSHRNLWNLRYNSWLILAKMISQAKQNLSHLVSIEKVAFPLHMWMLSLFNYCLGNDTYCSCPCTQMSSTESWWCCQSTFYILFCTGHTRAVGMHSVTHDRWVSGCIHLSGLFGSCPSQTWRDVITPQCVQLKSTSPEGGHLDLAKASPRMTLNTVRKRPRW